MGEIEFPLNALSDLVDPTRRSGETKFVFFTGKGGVGKSTMSCATAVWLAKRGYKTLLVTTDPAPNLSDIFGQEIGAKVTQINGIRGLYSIEIDPDVATQEYKERTISPIRQIVSDEKQLQVIGEQLNSPCVDEVAAFDKFIEFMYDPQYDVVIFDTAPTGHTIRLLELPSGWSETLNENTTTCIGPSASLQTARLKYEKAISYLQDQERTLFIFVSRPETLSLFETKRSMEELSRLGITTRSLIINGVLPEEACTDEFFKKKREDQEKVLAAIGKEFKDIERSYFPLKDTEMIGLSSLEYVGRYLYEGVAAAKTGGASTVTGAARTSNKPSLDTGKRQTELIELLTPRNARTTRYVFFTGKGGVGKSTVASITALYLAEKGYKTLILTTDPASHLQEIFGQPVEHEVRGIRRVDNLFAARIDQKKALEEYKKRILDVVKDRDADTRKSVEEDLNSPCAEEMSAFEKFMGYFELRGYDVIIFDTAPTGHTLRLLELPSEWKGFMDLGTLTKSTSEETRSKYSNVIETMRNKEKSTFVFVVYPEFTPIVEAWRASEDLKKQVGIEAGLVAVNYLLPQDYGRNEFFENRRAQQERYLSVIRDKFGTPQMAIPLFESEPKGLDDLRSLGRRVFDDTRRTKILTKLS